MSFLKTAFTSAAFLGAGLFTMAPNDADAQIRVQIGGGGYGYRLPFGGEPGQRRDLVQAHGRFVGQNRADHHQAGYHDRLGVARLLNELGEADSAARAAGFPRSWSSQRRSVSSRSNGSAGRLEA